VGRQRRVEVARVKVLASDAEGERRNVAAYLALDVADRRKLQCARRRRLKRVGALGLNQKQRPVDLHALWQQASDELVLAACHMLHATTLHAPDQHSGGGAAEMTALDLQ
jgi:hypothetical protein